MAIPYSIINHIMGSFGRSVFDPITPIDSMVPFIGWTFMIYVSLYLYYPAAAWFGRENDVGSFFDIHNISNGDLH